MGRPATRAPLHSALAREDACKVYTPYHSLPRRAYSRLWPCANLAARMTISKRLQTAASLTKAGQNQLARVGLLALSLAWTVTASGAAVAVEPPGAYVRPKLGDDELFIDQIFQSHLPTTLEKYALRLAVNPHLGDWQKKDYMRVTTTLRYGLTDNCELSVGSNLYYSHGHGGIRAFDEYGAASLQPGVKINFGQILFTGWETAGGLTYEFPTGHPAPELTDGLRHLRPFVTFSHRLESHPDLRVFVGFRFDAVSHTSLPGEFATNAFHESSTGITGGWVLDRDRLHYTFEASFDTNRLVGHGGEDIYTIRPGLLWEIPARGHKAHIRSNWMIGFAVNSTFGPGGSSLGASFKLRYSSDLKNQFRHHRDTPPPAAVN